MSHLSLNDVSIAYGNTPIINHASLELEQGQIGCFLGSSGCGKTTLLRAIAGFETPTCGTITLADTCISSEKQHIAPERRQIGMVFQDFALFPHLSIEDNIGFGLQRVSKRERKARVQYLLELIELDSYGKQYPHQLSGGQQQRIALARALAPKPKLLLLDEPFSSLDTDTRTHLAADVRQLLKKEDMTAILVTHDQNEAFTMADQIGVLHNTTLLQWDSCYELYHEPKHPYIATFIGEGQLLPATINQRKINSALGEFPIDHNGNGEVQLLLRPEHLYLNPQGNVKGTVFGKHFQGHEYHYELRLADGTEVEAHAPIDQIHAEIGELVCMTIRMSDPIVFPV